MNHRSLYTEDDGTVQVLLGTGCDKCSNKLSTGLTVHPAHDAQAYMHGANVAEKTIIINDVVRPLGLVASHAGESKQ